MSIETAKRLVSVNAVSRVAIECFDGRRWAIVLRGREDFILRSARQDPKAYAKIETALAEVRSLGLRFAEVEFSKWQRE
ncbi:hypothetical protein OU994_17415 [Pseudoduganella sp. SL102]|uniref:hypothetical protein n=1 Tax=Pseudoduganella sp. SL102 TaxID=2995154 RepID=UPI00248C21B7|nr:hypothetical protein [Pseudoduganella sp. SL102]WBS00102.1 hypothetical protein OU994_17415 [Pseudoduganella sp. SL102]